MKLYREVIAAILMPILLVNITVMAIVPAYALDGPPTWRVGWSLANVIGQEIQQRGSSAYMNQLVDPYVESCCNKRTSAWIGATATFNAVWIQVGWYKGAWGVGTCSDIYSSMKIYAEKYDGSTINCVQGGTPSANVRYRYEVLWVTNQGNGNYVWHAKWDGATVTTLTIPYYELFQDVSGETKDDSTPTATFETRADTLRYYDQAGTEWGWLYHTSECSSKYGVLEYTNTELKVYGTSPSPLCE